MKIFSGKTKKASSQPKVKEEASGSVETKAAKAWSLSGAIGKAAGSAVETAVSSGLAGKALSGAASVAGTTLAGKVAIGAAKGAVSGALGEVPLVSGILSVGAPDPAEQVRKVKKRGIAISVIGFVAGLLIGHFFL